jgi:hypothetical protein
LRTSSDHAPDHHADRGGQSAGHSRHQRIEHCIPRRSASVTQPSKTTVFAVRVLSACP